MRRKDRYARCKMLFQQHTAGLLKVAPVQCIELLHVGQVEGPASPGQRTDQPWVINQLTWVQPCHWWPKECKQLRVADGSNTEAIWGGSEVYPVQKGDVCSVLVTSVRGNYAPPTLQLDLPTDQIVNTVVLNNVERENQSWVSDLSPSRSKAATCPGSPVYLWTVTRKIDKFLSHLSHCKKQKYIVRNRVVILTESLKITQVILLVLRAPLEWERALIWSLCRKRSVKQHRGAFTTGLQGQEQLTVC